MKTNANIFLHYNITNKMQSVSVYKERGTNKSVEVPQKQTSLDIYGKNFQISQIFCWYNNGIMVMLIMNHYIWFVSECCDYWWEIASQRFGHQAITDQNLQPATWLWSDEKMVLDVAWLKQLIFPSTCV